MNNENKNSLSNEDTTNQSSNPITEISSNGTHRFTEDEINEIANNTYNEDDETMKNMAPMNGDGKTPYVFFILFMLIGVVLLTVGIINTINTKNRTKDYISTIGTYVGSSIYSHDDDGTTYRLTYSYVVNNVRYNISTNYGTGAVPDIGSTKTIRYNPNKPSEAIITGVGANAILFILGIMFTCIPLIPIISSISSGKTGSIKQRIIDALPATIFTLIGGLFYYVICSSVGNSLSPIVAFKAIGLWIIIPIAFIILGGIGTFSALFSQPKEEEAHSKTNEEIERELKREETFSNVLDKAADGMGIIYLISKLVSGLGITGFSLYLIIFGGDIATRLVGIPACIAGSAFFVSFIADILDIIKPSEESKTRTIWLQSLASKIYVIAFLVFWFGFLIFFDYFVILQMQQGQGGVQMLLFSLIFWAAGLFILYKNFIKRY